ncbi:MAG: hypothetical protein IKM17_03930, partial [Lentisphaeria bacterium]|nr:hypothetical protein [Lentisphaeria bacterium]
MERDAPVTARDNKEIPIPKISRKKWQPDWIYTMSDDMANQRAIFQCKKNGSLTWICTMSDDMANQRGTFKGDISGQKKWQ